ncbi:MAG: FGGY family carbohydrate kinase [Acidimicrobiales bacterium]
MGELLVGIDLGTTSTKVTLFDPDRGQLASASEPAALFSNEPGWSEADTKEWWSNICSLIPLVALSAGVPLSSIAGVATSGMVPALVLLDNEGRALRRAILQNDARAVSEIGELSEVLAASGYDVLGRTGSSLTQQSVAPTWRWLAHHEPDAIKRTATVVGSYDWLAIALGARRHVETNWAIESGLYEISGASADPVREAAGIPDEVCPVALAPGTHIGEVDAFAAEATSLPVGTPIYTGGADHVLAAYAAGLNKPGEWLVKLGGAGDILVVCDHPVVDGRWYLDAHPAPGLWLPNGCMATSGSLLRWVQSLVGDAPLGELDKEAEMSRPASLICLPYFLGEKSPLHDPDLRGCFVGLHLGHTRGDLFRASMEAVAFGFRNHVDVFGDAGIVVQSGRVSNGGSGSRVWKQIVVDVLGRELVSISGDGGASLGAALVAAVGSRAIASWELGEERGQLGEVIYPRSELASLYDDAYGMYLELQSTVTPVSHRLAARARR